MRLRLGIIAPGFSKSADDWAIPALQALAAGLAEELDVRLFSLRYPAGGRYVLGDLTHIAIGGGRRFGIASLDIWRHALDAVLREHAARPFHLLHAFWADESGLVTALAGMLLRLPTVVSLGGGELTYLPDIEYGTQGSAARRLVVRFSLNQARVVSAGSRYQATLARQNGVPVKKLKVLPLGVDAAVFAPGPAPDWRWPTIVQAASLTAVKNQNLLMRVLARAKASLPDIRLLLAGDGPLRHSLLRQAEELDLLGHIELRRAIAHPAMPALYAQGHLYLQTSRHESQGMSLLEALACGLPAIGTPVGILPEIACRQATWSEELLASQVVDVLADQQSYVPLRRQARALVERDYSLSSSIERFQSLYHALSGAR
jgi:glycogen(starch) synthase